MEHFKNFPQIVYDDNIILTNVLFRARIKEKILTNEVAFYNYRVRDEDKPEIIADKYYGHPRYTWLVFYANDIVDPQFDWVLNYQEFLSYLVKKYKTGEESDYDVISRLQTTVHHYENSKKQTVLSSYIGASDVTYYNYEDRLNEDKRDIKIIDSQYLRKIDKEFADIFR